MSCTIIIVSLLLSLNFGSGMGGFNQCINLNLRNFEEKNKVFVVVIVFMGVLVKFLVFFLTLFLLTALVRCVLDIFLFM